MEAKDLRLGNLITDKWASESSAFVVTRITDRSIRYGANFSASCDNVKGIELTPEWLERFGFEKKRKQIAINVCGELFNYWTGPILIWEVKEGVYTLDAVFKNPIHRHPNPSIVYTTVHSLQNLTFALTGRELELKK